MERLDGAEHEAEHEGAERDRTRGWQATRHGSRSLGAVARQASTSSAFRSFLPIRASRTPIQRPPHTSLNVSGSARTIISSAVESTFMFIIRRSCEKLAKIFFRTRKS